MDYAKYGGMSRSEDEAYDRERQDKFNRMSPAEHLAAAQAALQVDVPGDQIAEGMKHIDALKGTALEKQGESVRSHYEAAQAKAGKEWQARAVRQMAEQAKARERDAEAERIDYAKRFEETTLGKGMNSDVRAYGPRHTILEAKWVLATKVDVYQIAHDPNLLDDLRIKGFKKFTVTDGYDHSWTWTL